ncbi:MAG: galactokinase [Saprospiraceae bacterium]
MVNTIVDAFHTVFGAAPRVVVRSPGRVNIIGEHTDYNEGFVLPAAINKYIYVCAGLRDDSEIHLFAADFKETFTCSIDALAPRGQDWANYVLGVADQLLVNGHTLRGFNLVFGGDVPLGAGLSSSAAVECGVIFALDCLLGLELNRMDMVLMAQQAEHKYAGVRCGVMDMFASVFGREGQAMRLDCRSLEYAYVPLDLKDNKMLLLNSNVKHSLASTEYNTRRQQCEQGVEWVQAEYPTVHSLRDVDMDMLNRCVAPRSPGC